jgi:hypothetical protein
VGPLTELMIAILAPTAAGYAILASIRGWRRFSQGRYRPAPPEPIERLTARLRRLRAELHQTQAEAGTTARGHRVLAVRGAYVDVLSQACGRLAIDPPQGDDRATPAELQRVEAALLRLGLDVRETAAL